MGLNTKYVPLDENFNPIKNTSPLIEFSPISGEQAAIQKGGSDVLHEEDKRDKSYFRSVLAGIGSGIIFKPLEGIATLGAELTDRFGTTTNKAAEMEKYFDDLNPWDELAESTLAGKITQTIFGIGATAGAVGLVGTGAGIAGGGIAALFAGRKAIQTAKVVKSVAKNAINAKKMGTFTNLKNYGRNAMGSPFAKGVARFSIAAAISPEAQELTFFGDENRRNESSKEAQRRLTNRLIFAGESAAMSAIIGGAIHGIRRVVSPGGYKNSKYVTQVENDFQKYISSKGIKTKGGFEEYRSMVGLNRFVEKQAIDTAKRLDDSLIGLYNPLKRFFSMGQKNKNIEGLKATVFDALSKGQKINFKGFVPIQKTGQVRIKKEALDKVVAEAKRLGMSNAKIHELKASIQNVRNVIDVQMFKNLNLKSTLGKTGQVFSKQELKIQNSWRQSLKKNEAALKKATKSKKDTAVIKSYDPNTGKISKETISVSTLKDRIKNLKSNLQTAAEKKHGYAIYGAARKAYKGALGRFIPAVFKSAMANQFKSGFARRLYRHRPAQEQIDTAIRYIRETHAGDITEQGAKNLVERIIKQGAVPKFTVLKGTKTANPLGKATLRYDPSIEALMGRVNDPVFTAVNAVGNLAAKRHKQEMTNSLFDLGLKTGNISKNKDVARGLTEVYKGGKNDLPSHFSVGHVRKGVKQSFYMTKEFKNNFLNPLKRADGTEMSGWLKAYHNLILLPKMISQSAKTVASGVTHVRNFVSAAAFAMANGNLTMFNNPLTKPGRYAKAFRESFLTRGTGADRRSVFNPIKFNDEYNKYLRLGVVNTNVRLGDMRALMKDISVLNAEKTTAFGNSLMGRALRPFVTPVKGVYKWAERQYQAEDDFWKIINFHGEKDRLFRWNKYAHKKLMKDVNAGKIVMNPNTKRLYSKEEAKAAMMSNNEIETIAARLVRDQVPNYDLVPEMIKTLRKLPIGNFVSFPAEMVRTSGNIYQRAIWEITTGKATGNAALRNEGYKRLLGLTYTVAGLPATVQSAARVAYNVKEEEMLALKRFVPEWSKNSVLIPIRDNKTGNLKYMDLSYSLAYDVIARPGMTLINALAEGIEDEKSLMEILGGATYTATKEFMEPFVDEAIFTKALADVSPILGRAGRRLDGKPVWNEGDPFGEKAAKALIHSIWKPMQPGSIDQYKRILFYSGEEGEPDLYGRKYEKRDEMMGLAGFRVVDPDPGLGLKYKVSQFNKEINASQKAWFSDVNRGGPQTAEDIYKQWWGAQRSSFDAQKSMFKDLDAALTLNVDLSDYMKETDRISREDLRVGVQFGHFTPYLPSQKTFDTLRERATRDGWLPDLEEGADFITAKWYETNGQPLMDINPFDWWHEDWVDKKIPRSNTLINNNKILNDEFSEVGDQVTSRINIPTEKPPVRTAEARTDQTRTKKRGPLGMPLPKTPAQQKRLATMQRGQKIFGVTDPIFSKDGGEVKKYADGGEVQAEPGQEVLYTDFGSKRALEYAQRIGKPKEIKKPMPEELIDIPEEISKEFEPITTMKKKEEIKPLLKDDLETEKITTKKTLDEDSLLTSIRQKNFSRFKDVVNEKDMSVVLNKVANFIGKIESDNRLKAKNKATTASGIYQFTNASAITAANRVINTLGRENVPSWVIEISKGEKRVTALNKTQQQVLFEADMFQKKGSDKLLKQIFQGNTAALTDYYYRLHHTNPDDATIGRVERFAKNLNLLEDTKIAAK